MLKRRWPIKRKVRVGMNLRYGDTRFRDQWCSTRLKASYLIQKVAFSQCVFITATLKPGLKFVLLGFFSNFSKLFNFSAIFVPVPFCQLVRIWNLFLTILLASKNLQPNFEFRGVWRSLSMAGVDSHCDKWPLELLERAFFAYFSNPSTPE